MARHRKNSTDPVADERSTPTLTKGAGNPTTIRYRTADSAEFVELEGDEATDRLKNHLRTSLQMQHLAILCGSGTSIESKGPSMPDLWKAALHLPEIDAARHAVSYAATGDSDIEEFLSRCDAFLSLNPSHSAVAEVRRGTIAMILDECRKAGDSGCLDAQRDLLKKVARRRARDSRVKLFTTNYDLCFENAAAAIGLIPVDGFSFTSPRRFDPRFFDYDIVKRSTGTESASFVPGVFQYYKLHGSVDWCIADGSVVVDPKVESDQACLIYPARTKFQQSYVQPHLELMARFLATLREPNTCLVVAGFGFNDAHLTAPILAALRSNPHFRLIVISRTIDAKLGSSGRVWQQLGELAKTADISFIASSFREFVGLVPDLAALSPAHVLENAVQAVARQT